METQTEWATYRLTATRHGKTSVYRFEDANDIEATYTAMATVLAKAQRSMTWAKGRIELSRGGEVLQVMEAKS